MGLNVQQWNEAGNTGITPLTEFLGTTDNTPIPFRTTNVDRMRLWQNNVITLNVGTSNAATINQGGFLGISSYSKGLLFIKTISLNYQLIHKLVKQ